MNIDSVADCRPDMVHDLSRPLPFAHGSVDEVLADAVLEHLDKYARYFIVYDWVRVLKMNGTLTVGVPNFQKILYRYFKWDFDNFVDTIFGETLWESRYYLGHFGSHKWGYSEKTLKRFLETFGMGDISIKKECLSLTAQARKLKEVAFDELKTLKIYSSNNACGTGKPYVTLEEIMKLTGFETR